MDIFPLQPLATDTAPIDRLTVDQLAKLEMPKGGICSPTFASNSIKLLKSTSKVGVEVVETKT